MRNSGDDLRHFPDMTTMRISAGIVLGLALLASGCDTPTTTAAPGSTSAAKPGLAPTAEVASASPSASATADEGRPRLSPAMDDASFAKLVNKLSEPNANFFSDNYISNETSYLQIAKALASRKKGGTYVGVGPEQNFTYIALMEADMAYIVDIRRDNMVLHLLYKAAFEKATSRAHFLALLIGRDYAGDEGLSEDASLDDVLARAEQAKASKDVFERIHRELREHIEKQIAFELDERDARTLRRSHQAFYDDGLDIRFSLKEQSFRKYPSLRELVLQEDPDGDRAGFLASEETFRYVQRMQRENRIVPLVGDFAGDRAMPALAEHMKEQKETLRAFYVSNVEQYLLVDGKWWKWQKNVAAFPIDEHSLFIRCYLDQGKPHPAQMTGHRTTTTLHPIAAFNERDKPYPSMLALANDNRLAAK
jgi:hypothetical protein